MFQLPMLPLRKHIVTLIVLTLGLICAPHARGGDQIRIGYGSLSTNYAAIWVAGEARLFHKNGIDAEVLYLESALVRTALITGDIAMGGMSGTTMAAPRLQGADPILIASFLNSFSTASSCVQKSKPSLSSRGSAWELRASAGRSPGRADHAREAWTQSGYRCHHAPNWERSDPYDCVTQRHD